MNLTSQRTAYLYARGYDLDRVSEIEQRFSKYVYLPLDLPHLDVSEKVAEYFFEVATPIKKLQHDIAGSANDAYTFKSIDFTFRKTPYGRDIWQKNLRSDVIERVPELLGLLEALPYNEPPDFMLWSSRQRVTFHRDSGPWIDGPCSLRSMLLDENPTQTLQLKETPAISEYHMAKSLPDTPSGSFGWNNMRAQHASTYDPLYRKVLLIVHNGLPFDLDKLEALLDRSEAKYSQNAILSACEQSDFVLTR